MRLLFIPLQAHTSSKSLHHLPHDHSVDEQEDDASGPEKEKRLASEELELVSWEEPESLKMCRKMKVDQYQIG